jgi:hypothetical protein
MTDTHHDHHDQVPTRTEQSTPPRGQMDSRMMWVMMLGCCLAIPLALIIGGVGLGGAAGLSPWLLGVAAVLAVALVVTRRISSGPRCDPPPDDHA